MLAPLTHDDPSEIGGYRLLARLGHGGMGTVYLARSAGGRTVALKTMHARIAAEAAARTRFHLETDAARIIGSHHGATVVDADPTARTPWLATEYVLGPPLDDAVTLCGPLPEASVRALGAALAGALAQLHASDVVHRDLKPSNIMVTAYGPKIIDFGIARAAGDDRLTRTGTAAGTPAFMSPEQATGQEHTPAGDVFALAGVLVFAATGHGPFGTGQAADLLYRVRYSDPDLTGLPAGLAAVLSGGLAKDPARRLTTGQLAAQLHNGHGEFADHLPPTLLTDIARRATEVWKHQPQRLPAPADHATEDTVPASPREVSRRKLLTIGGAGLIGATAVGGGIWTWAASADGSRDSAGGKSKPPKPTAEKGDWLWELPLRLKGASLSPPVPLSFGVSLAIADDDGLRTIDVGKGGVDIPSLLKGPAHRCTDDEDIDESRVYASESPRSGNHPLTISSVKSGGDLKPDIVELEDYNGVLPATQLLSAYAGVVFLAAGQGEHSDSGIGYESSQKWYLLAVDVHTAKVRWRQPLPSRPRTSKRLHFLAARAVKDHLAVLQEMPNGRVSLAVHDSRRGKELWRQELDVPDPEAIRGRLAADDWSVYPPVGHLRALHLKDGKEQWSFGPGRAKARTGPPAAKGTSLYAVEEGLGLVSLDSVTGELLWRAPDRSGADLDVTLPPAPGVSEVYAYSSKSGLLRSFSYDTGKAGTARRARGDRFYAHDGIPEAIVAIGTDYFAAYPYK
ncbi:protein kinase domain-containing protein [Streptomyces sp. AM8-1-1]|uniref:serine/threonine-protein kinase n=1 Tax=Streptomyces sp. AM8-1-1 TaxID=3075825 RepID=UPI0028C3B344|nr:protein kinase [Streptomyces sp. AM8-1-1]WNO71941.1 protein kinase [Streptomyces sp. AM8-1-1]